MPDLVDDMCDPTKIVWEKNEKEEMIAIIQQLAQIYIAEQTYKWVV
jgi:hypothetical protein